MILLKPDGAYFYFVEIYEKLTKEILQTDNWEEFIKDYEIAKSNFVQEPFGKLTNIHISREVLMTNAPRPSSTGCYYFGDY